MTILEKSKVRETEVVLSDEMHKKALKTILVIKKDLISAAHF